MVVNSPSFCLSGKAFISPLCLKASCWIGYFWLVVSAFQYFEDAFHPALACKVAAEKSDDGRVGLLCR